MSIPHTVSCFADFKKALADDAAGRADSVRKEIRCVFSHLSFVLNPFIRTARRIKTAGCSFW